MGATRLKLRDTLTAGGTTYGLTEYKYDADRRPTCTAGRVGTTAGTDPCTPMTASDGSGADLIAKTDYDPATGRVSATWENGVRVAAYGYSDNGKVTSLTDARLNVTGYAYDGFDRATTTTYASTSDWGVTSEGASAYDADSHVTSYTKRDGTIIGSTYDALGRLTDQTLPSEANQASPHFGYDLMGRLTGASASNGTAAWINGVAYTIDALGRTTKQVSTIANSTSRETNFAYDAAGRRTRITWGPATGSPASFYVDYVYWPTNDLREVRENGAATGTGRLAVFDYNDLGDRVKLTRGNGLVTNWTPDAVSRLTTLAHGFATADTLSTTFTRDKVGRITTRDASSQANAWNQYAAGTQSYTPDVLNRYTQVGGASQSYDKNGNLKTLPSGNTATYNADDQLTSGNGASLSYDPLGRLASVSASNSTTFDYEGQDLIAEINGSGALAARYVHADGIDEPIVWYGGSNAADRRWLHADERGSIVAVSDEYGNRIGTNRYDAYGVPASSNLGRFGYTGQTWLPELGLWYYKARMYAPALGRFVQTDPIGVAGGVNLYAYVGNDPVNGRDPSGLADISCADGTYFTEYPGIQETVCDSHGGIADFVVRSSRSDGGSYDRSWLPSSGDLSGNPYSLSTRLDGGASFISGRASTDTSVTSGAAAGNDNGRPKYCFTRSYRFGQTLDEFGELGQKGSLTLIGAGVYGLIADGAGLGFIGGGATAYGYSGDVRLAGALLKLYGGAPLSPSDVFGALLGPIGKSLGASDAAGVAMDQIYSKVTGKIIQGDGCK